MPGLAHRMAGAFARDHETVKLSRQADREVADIDHLLHFTSPFGEDFTRLDRNQLP